MLERPGLIVATSNIGGQRPILDAESGASLGVALRLGGKELTWLDWLLPPSTAVQEGPDGSLLFVMRRFLALAPRWRVLDADDHLVAQVFHQRIEGPFGRTLALLEQESRERMNVRARGGQLIATLDLVPAGVRVLFGAHPEDSPFLRMAILAVALRS